MFDHADAVRADEPHAVAARQVAQLGLSADVAHLPEPGAQHHDARHALCRALAHDVDHGGGGNGDDRQVDGAGDVEHGRVRLHAGDLLGARVDRVHRAGEPAGQQVAEHLVPDRVRVPAGADHRDRPRREDAGHRCRLGVVLSLLDRGPRPIGGFDQQLDVHDAVLDRGSVPRSRRPGTRRASGGCGQRLGDEPGDPALAGGGRQVLEQDGADPAALLFVADDERHLGRVGTRARGRSGRRRRAGRRARRPAPHGLSWSTWVNRSTSSGLSVGFGEKNRRNTVSSDRPAWNATRRSASSGPSGRTWTVPPSARITSHSQCAGAAPRTGRSTARESRGTLRSSRCTEDGSRSRSRAYLVA